MLNQQEDTPLFSEAHYRLAMQATGVGMWDWDLVHDKQSWNEECRAILGVSPEAEASLAHFMALVHPDDKARVQEQLAESLRKRVKQDVTYRVIWPDGSVHWITSKGMYLYDADGRVVRLLGVVFDMTAQKEADEKLVRELEHQQAFQRAIVNQAPSGLVIAEAPSGKITFCNEQALKMLGQEVREVGEIADYIQYRVLHLDGTPYELEEYPLARVLLTGEAVTGEETIFHRRDGTLVHFSTNAAPVYNAQGEMLAGVLTFYDTTERYELERKKDEFITMASHELRTPLTSLRGNLQLAERRLKQLHEEGASLTDPDGRASLERLIIWVERALRQDKVECRLINDLLDATRILARKLHVELKPCDLTQIVRDAVNDVHALAATRTIE
ncbi:MAG: PAS domain S-box protein, partial [Ktedonobacteraceae bacterium]